jgi:outer membrane protein assembly factor BamB
MEANLGVGTAMPRRMRRRSGLYSGIAVLATVVGAVSASGANAAPRHAPARAQAGPQTTLDWPTYLHDNARSGSTTEAVLNAANAPTLGVKWKATTGNSVVAGAAVVNGVVYVGSWDGFEYALNATTGAVIWKTSLGMTTDPNCSYPVSAGVTSSATVQGGVVYVGGGDSFWYALDANSGAILWKVFTGDNSVAGAHYNWSSPLIYNGFAYIGVASNCDNPLVQGQLLQVNLTTHTVTNTANFVPNGGQVGGGVWTSPTVDAATNTVFVDTGTINLYTQTLAQAVVALDATTLAVKSSWQLPFEAETFDSDWGVTPTLVTDTAGDQLLSLANKNGLLYTFNRNNLAAGPIWSQRVALGGECPTCGDGTISSGSFVNSLTIGAYTGPVLFYAAGQNMYNGSGNQGGVWAFNPGTGAVLWFHPTSGPILGALAYDNGVLVTGQGSAVEVINAANGQALYDFLTPQPVYAAAAISRGQIYIGGTDGKEYAFGLPATTATPPADPNCPVGFTCQDIGNPQVAGNEHVNADGSVTVTAGGSGARGASDQMRIITKPVTGDFQISVNDFNQTGGAYPGWQAPQLGIMIRESNAPGSPYYAALQDPTYPNEGETVANLIIFYRDTWNAPVIEMTQEYPAAFPRLVMVQRRGDNFQTLTSSDGVNYWLVPGTMHAVVMPTTLMGGMGIGSGAPNATTTATYSNFTVAPPTQNYTLLGTNNPCPAGWTCQGVNAPNPPGDQTVNNGTYTLSGGGWGITSGVFSAYGKEDSFHYVYKTLQNDQTITAQFTGFGSNAPAGAEAGLMMRASMDPHSQYYGIFVYPNGTAIVQWRVHPNMVERFAFVKLPVLASPVFLKVARYTDTRFTPAPSYYTAATSSDGVNWTWVPGTTAAIDMGGGGAGPTLVGLAADAITPRINVPASFANVAVSANPSPPPGVCPTNWNCADVGASHRAGDQTFLNPTWTTMATGEIWDVYDKFRYIWQPLTGDGTVSARVASMQNPGGPWAKAGVMIRAGATDPQAPYYGVFATPQHGIAVQWRATEGALTNQVQLGAATAPIYLMASRYTDTSHNNIVYYTAYFSTDNVHWTQVPGSTVQLNLAGSLSAGLAASAYSDANAMTTTFDNFALLGSAPAPAGICPPQWTCEDVNGAVPGGSQVNSGGAWTINAGGSDIWDVSDQFHYMWQSLAADGAVTARVTAEASGLQWAKGGVMLRSAVNDPDPSAPYYGLFVTPSNGIVVQWRSSEGATTQQIQTAGTTPVYLMVDRWTNAAGVTYYQALTSGDGKTWTAVPGSLMPISALTGALQAGIATDSWNQGNAATWSMDTIAVTTTALMPQGACANPWACEDIGGATPAGSQTNANGIWTIQGGGGDIWGNLDAFHLVAQTLPADGTVRARVVSQSGSDPWAKAGVMIRSIGNNPDAAAPYYAILTTPNNGIAVQWRATEGGSSNQIALAGVAPVYLEVTRWTDTSGATPVTYFTAYTSTNGTTWTAVPGSTTVLNITGTTLAGLAVTSHNPNVLGTVKFDTVSLTTTGVQPAGICIAAWNCTDIGGATPVGAQNLAGGAWTIQAGGGDIWDPADSFRYIFHALPGDGTVSARLASLSNSNPWAKAGLMLRRSTDPVAPYYAIFVTPANGLVIQYRTLQGGTTSQVAAGPGAGPIYVRITRTGTTFSAATSTNGTAWTVVPGSSVSLPALTGSLLSGMAVTSHDTTKLVTAVFDNVH